MSDRDTVSNRGPRKSRSDPLPDPVKYRDRPGIWCRARHHMITETTPATHLTHPLHKRAPNSSLSFFSQTYVAHCRCSVGRLLLFGLSRWRSSQHLQHVQRGTARTVRPISTVQEQHMSARISGGTQNTLVCTAEAAVSIETDHHEIVMNQIVCLLCFSMNPLFSLGFVDGLL